MKPNTPDTLELTYSSVARLFRLFAIMGNIVLVLVPVFHLFSNRPSDISIVLTVTSVLVLAVCSILALVEKTHNRLYVLGATFFNISVLVLFIYLVLNLPISVFLDSVAICLLVLPAMLNLAALILVRKSFIRVSIQYLILAILLAIAPTFVAANTNTQDWNASSLVGKWTRAAKRTDGSTIIVHVVLGQNMQFSGTTELNGKLYRTYSGTWSISGKYLVWRYDFSSRPLPEKFDADEIVSIDESKLVLLSKSRANGRNHEYLRER